MRLYLHFILAFQRFWHFIQNQAW